MRQDRAERPNVREEHLSAPAARTVALSAWRGRSGRRYVVTVHSLAEATLIEAPGAVILGVRRADSGYSDLMGAGHTGTVAEAVELARADGATEIHLHRLAISDIERDAIVADLLDPLDAA